MSFSILLVDDEAVDLEWLRRRVLALELDLRVIATVNSGFEALKVLREQPADIILSDIRMPIMTGTEFARMAKEIRPEIKIVFISGHEDFGYAKEAIAINASAYLLKPVADDELERTVSSLCAELEKERREQRSLSETISLVNRELLLRWFNAEVPDAGNVHVLRILAPLLEKKAAAALIEIDDLEWKLRDAPERERRASAEETAAFIAAFAAERGLGLTFAAGSPERVLALAEAAGPEEELTARLEELVESVRRSMPFTVTVGVGGIAHTAAELHESYKQAQGALSAKWLLGKNRLIREAAALTPSVTVQRIVDEQAESLLNAIYEYDLVAIDDSLLLLFGGASAPGGRNEVYDLIIRITSKLHAELQQKNENLYELLKWESHHPDLLFRFETVHDVLSWLRRRLFELSEMLYVKRQRQKRKLIDQITDYIEENLEHKLTLKEVAAHFDFTPNYLGQLFKDETGVHFSDYLNKRRIGRVCELLSDPSLKVYEIADRMGYKNIIYFNRQFKQAMGMTPGEFRKTNKI